MTAAQENPGPRHPWHIRIALGIVRVYWRFQRGMTLGVRAVVLCDDGAVFLVRHSYLPGWHLPGGGVEPGETLLVSLARELGEEANVALTGTPVLHGVFHNAQSSRRDHVAVFVVRDFVVRGERAPDWEIREAGFFARDALPDGVTAGTRRRIEEVTAGRQPTPVW